MKYAFAIACASFFTLPLAAQQSPTQPVTIQMQCRDMATTGNYLAPNETMISNKACHAVNVQRVDDKATAEPAATTMSSAPAPSRDQQYAPSVLPTPVASENPLRVVLMDSASWQARGGWSGTPDSKSSSVPAAAPNDKETANTKQMRDDLIAGFSHQCPQAIVTDNFDKANFAVTLEREGKNRWSMRNDIVVFNRSGDHLFSGSSRSLSDPLASACQAIVAAAKP